MFIMTATIKRKKRAVKMSGLSELEQGKLIEAVESLEKQVSRLNTRIDSL